MGISRNQVERSAATHVGREPGLVERSRVLGLRVPHLVEDGVNVLGRCAAREREDARGLREGRAEIAVRRFSVVDRTLGDELVACTVVRRSGRRERAGVDDRAPGGGFIFARSTAQDVEGPANTHECWSPASPSMWESEPQGHRGAREQQRRR
jgi:hypothetical protein